MFSPAGLLLCVSMFSSGHGLLLNRAMDHDILCGRHLDELVTRNGTVFMPAAVALYTPECDSKLQEYKLSQNMPPDYAILFGRYDYETTHKYSWFKFDKRDDLYQRYKPSKCFELLFFAPNTSIYEPVRIPIPADKKLSEVLWEVVKIKFSVRNLFGGDIEVRLSVDELPKSVTILHPGEEEDCTAHITHWLEVYDYATGNLIYGRRINHEMNTTEIVIDRYDAVPVDREGWIVETRLNTKKTQKEYAAFSRETSLNYLRAFKQPPVVENLTETGYYTRDLPSFLIKDLKDFAKKNKAITVNHTELGMNYQAVPLTQEMDMKLNMVIKMMLEDWSNADLRPITGSTVMISRNGATAGLSMGNAAEHVVGASIVIDKDPAKKDWVLEVMGHDSNRRNLTLSPGQALFYEPATVLISRPYPFLGKRFVSLNYYYAPEHDWDWGVSEDGKYLTKDKENIEPLNILATSKALERCEKRKKRDEL